MTAIGLRKLWANGKTKWSNVKNDLSFRESISLFLLITLCASTLFMQLVALKGIILSNKRFVDRIAVIQTLKKTNIPEKTNIAVFEAGINFFLPEYQFHDLLGKNDKTIAFSQAKFGLVGHNKWDYNYSLGKIRPDLIICRDGFSNLGYNEAYYLVHHPTLLKENSVLFSLALYVHPEFNDNYAMNQLDIITPFNTHWVFARKGSDIDNLKIKVD
jgi:hypothetical protein